MYQICKWVVESEELDNLYDDSSNFPDFIQPNEQCDSESVANVKSNTSRYNRLNVSRGSRSRSPLSDTASPPTFYLSKDNITKWNMDSPALNVRMRSHNIISQMPGVK